MGLGYDAVLLEKELKKGDNNNDKGSVY